MHVLRDGLLFCIIAKNFILFLQAEDKSLNLVKLKTIDVNLKKVVDENVTEKNISIMGTGGKLADVTNIGKYGKCSLFIKLSIH